MMSCKHDRNMKKLHRILEGNSGLCVGVSLKTSRMYTRNYTKCLLVILLVHKEKFGKF